MNIAFVVVKHIARGGGIETYTKELGSRLVARGHRVRVYSMPHYGTVASTYQGMEIIPIPCIPLRQCEKLSAAIVATAHAAISPWADMVHLHTLAPGAMGWLTQLWRKPALIQYHGLEWKRSRWNSTGASVLKFLEQWSVRVNRHYCAVSRVQCAYFREHYGIDVRYIPSGAEVKAPCPAQAIYDLGLEPQRYILFASRLVREKGAHYLIEAFRRLRTSCKLVVAGGTPGADPYQDDLFACAGGDPRIIFPGFVEGRLREELFSHACIYVQPSDIEGLSIALLEALAYGLTCLVSDIPENIEAIDTHGVTFRRGDQEDLAAKLQMILDTHRHGLIATTAQAHAHTHYSWDHVTDEFERYYQEVLAAQATITSRAVPLGVKRAEEPEIP